MANEGRRRFHSWWSYPSTRGLHIDDPQTTELRRRIIQKKAFLRKIYKEWYRAIAESLPPGQGKILELGSGAGFLQKAIPDVIPSELFRCTGISVVLDARAMPFRDRTLRGIVMINVFHHLDQPRKLLVEASRCVRSGGTIVMIEPWVTAWSQWVYRHLHHEDFDPQAAHWEFDSCGPLSGANGALPWIVFERDRETFEREFPEWQIELVQLMMPFRYLMSGGVAVRSLMPGWTFSFWRSCEKAVESRMSRLAMFARIVLKKK